MKRNHSPKTTRAWALVVAMLLPLGLSAQDYDFSKRIGNNTLYFYITSTGGKNGATVEVTYPGASEENPWKGFHRPYGELAIPRWVSPDRVKGEDPEDADTTLYTVTAIRYNAFAGCDHITWLLLPGTLREIGEGAFAGCRRIAHIEVLAKDPPRMDESAFDGVSLETPVRIPAGTYEHYRQAVGWRQFSEMTEF